MPAATACVLNLNAGGSNIQMNAETPSPAFDAIASIALLPPAKAASAELIFASWDGLEIALDAWVAVGAERPAAAAGSR